MQMHRTLISSLAFALVAMCGLCRSDDNLPKHESLDQAPDGMPVLRFPINPTRPWFYARIERTDSQRFVEISPARNMPRSAALTEGFYLAISHKTATPSLDTPRVLRVTVAEVLDRGRAKLVVSAAAAKALARREFLTLFRPATATTADLARFPDSVIEVVGAAVWPKSEAEQQACRTRSLLNLKEIALALHGFENEFGKFPPAAVYGPDGKPWHSWRVLVLPYLECADLYNKYRWDEPWDGPNNSKLLEEMPSVYSDPIYGENDGHYTHYSAITGAGMAFSEKGARFDGEEVHGAKLRGTKIREFTDGTSETLVVGPVGPGRKIPWMKPEDVEVDSNFPDLGKPGSFAVPYQTNKGNAGPFLRADGSVLIIPRGVDRSMFRSALTISGGDVVDWNDMQGADLPSSKVSVPVICIAIENQPSTARLVMEDVEIPPQIEAASDSSPHGE
jgi:hypothetical protein